MFLLTALTGALLSGASSAGAADPAEPAAAEQSVPTQTVHRAFAQSLVMSGAAGLTVAVTGLVMVGRRRRQW